MYLVFNDLSHKSHILFYELLLILRKGHDAAPPSEKWDSAA